MNILHVVDERWDSGIVNYALTLARGLAQKNHHVTVAVQGKKPPAVLARDMGLDLFELTGLASWCSLYFHMIKKNIEIINVHTGRSHTWAALVKRKNMRVIRTRGDARLPKNRFLKKFILSRTNRLIVPAQFIQRGYKETFPDLPARKISLIPQGIDHNEFLYVPEPSSSGSITLGIIGRLDPVKGHRFLIEALAKVKQQFPKIKLLVAGREENVSIQELSLLADSLGVHQEVEFTGHVPSVKEIIQKCHIGVVASTGSEAVSRATLEWMASGRAVVATKVGGIPDFISHEITGLLVEPADAEGLAAAITQLINDPDMRNRIGRYARKAIETTHSLNHFVSRTEAIYRDAIKHPAC